MDNSASLAPFFAPRGIALVGASTDSTKLGYGLARNLVQCNYQGVIHFVNPKGGSLLGRPMYSSIRDLPDPVDLAVILIPAAGVASVLQDCAAQASSCYCLLWRVQRLTCSAKMEAELVKIAKDNDIHHRS
jgi:acetyltransferase